MNAHRATGSRFPTWWWAALVGLGIGAIFDLHRSPVGILIVLACVFMSTFVDQKRRLR